MTSPAQPPAEAVNVAPRASHAAAIAIPDLTRRTDPHVQHALTLRCEVCRAKPGADCTNSIDPGKSLPGGRIVHYGRAEIRAK